MKRYSYPIALGLFTNTWGWFGDPDDTYPGDILNFFSYEKFDAPGFKRKEGLTSIIDLSLSSDELRAKMRKKFTSDLITEGEKKGIKVKQSNDISEFTKLYKRFRREKGIVADNPRAFTHGTLFVAHLNGQMIAGHLFIGEAPYIRSWVAASLRLNRLEWKDRRIMGCANRMLIWEAMKYAKDHGYKYFDMGGIHPESQKKWERSLAEYKESFGGAHKMCYYYSKVNSPILKLWLKFRRFL